MARQISAPELLTRFKSEIWAIYPQRLTEFLSLILTKKTVAEDNPDEEDPANEDGALPAGIDCYLEDGVGILAVNGIMVKRDDWYNGYLGLVSTAAIQRSFLQLMADPRCEEILLAIDSPGGTVDGVAELADTIYQARGRKKITCYADGCMASAAYWIGSAADRVLTYRTALIGSIGVYILHGDFSGAYKQWGINITIIRAGEFKILGNQYEPLDEKARGVLQAQVDGLYAKFIQSVAAHRGAAVEYVKSDMAEGRVFAGDQAKAARLVDEVVDGVVMDDLIGLSNKYRNKSIISQQHPIKEARMGLFNNKKLTLADLKAEHADVYAEALAEGKAQVDINAAKAQTVAAEKTRAAAILALAADDQAALAFKLFSEGKTEAEAAVALCKDAQERKTKAKAAFEASAAAPDKGAKPAEQPAAPDHATAWDADEKLRLKFKGNKTSYLEAMKHWEANKAEFGENLDSYLSVAAREGINSKKIRKEGK